MSFRSAELSSEALHKMVPMRCTSPCAPNRLSVTPAAVWYEAVHSLAKAEKDLVCVSNRPVVNGRIRQAKARPAKSITRKGNKESPAWRKMACNAPMAARHPDSSRLASDP